MKVRRRIDGIFCLVPCWQDEIACRNASFMTTKMESSLRARWFAWS